VLRQHGLDHVNHHWQWLISRFGEVRPTTGDRGYGQTVSGPSYAQAVKFDLRYPGQVFDEETGLSYNLHRYYDAATGRYIQADPIGLEGGWNRFGYVGGDPLGFADDEGLQRRSATPSVSYAQSLINAPGVNLIGQILRYQPNCSYSYASVPGYGYTPSNISQLQGILQRLQSGNSCVSGSSGAVIYDVDALARAAGAPDRNGLTRAGRALDKHGAGQRSLNSPFPAPRGGPQQKNADGQFQVEDILTHPGSVFNPLGRGGVGVRSPDGREIRFDANGRFAGFIE
jgi:RHS repeat-associated protein